MRNFWHSALAASSRLLVYGGAITIVLGGAASDSPFLFALAGLGSMALGIILATMYVAIRDH
ncbi:MAG: hypothetical protein UX53_C0005G0017 [Candidatus Azambacteria bacterium GW2011_GWB2_46_37]|uniref:Uncharacterized protein n=10 Tax=Candidatus Azamiibacteriota TaxID=1752741 RepID=A0A0G1SEH6_9BACT|nr:MAG: hypothetical protein UX27_C0032G0002 [Candidatus Azambacteria bacterium GW2011_GWA2_45_90]KKU22754.1 MAG: hypothetical protein UX33_C0005G0017 [Candidatus Azambacteria bacterium GW2011_GWC1_46_13]KKU36294.1 MAG: hypothetical protein UX51_C0051G0002 [Candidatus Azambacteria bacterium GW2011_GWF2_46_32]KKU36505.1 MAG: hypothetical protein UX48_C0004G0012 [Candidatus Azambacteria bacterium GW2011_GWB1_46_27]KKU39474.1 MAG: hypothetical protein UX53_C0005G0017 [Candidatus Azambacteria bacte